jgi:anti-sigma B factor antagonist
MTPLHSVGGMTPEPGVVRATYDTDTRIQLITLEGEFDISNVGRLDQVFGQAIQTGARDVVVDLSGVKFLDATTVHSLLHGWKRVTGANRRFVLVKPPDRIWRLFVMIGRSRTFATFPSREEALRHLARWYR